MAASAHRLLGHVIHAVSRLATVGLFVALFTSLAGCEVGLYSNLNETEANELVAALAAGNIPARKERVEGNQWQVHVDESRLGAALELLRAEGLPHERFASMGALFVKQGLVSTPAEERMRYIYAVSQELSQTLRSIDGVVSARVHVVIPSNDPLSDKIKPSSAAVFIKHRPDTDLRLLTPAVKDLVAHSIEGLNADQVSLSLVQAARPAPPGTAGSVVGSDEQRLFLGFLSTRNAVVLIAVLALAALSLMVLPTLLRRRGGDWRAWLQHEVLRR